MESLATLNLLSRYGKKAADNRERHHGAARTGPGLPARLASVARAAWSLLKACAELYGIACFIDWLLKLSDLV